MKLTRLLAGVAVLGTALLSATPALAQTAAFPTKPLRIIVPYPPGGATDVAARLVAPRLAEELKQNVVVENRPGASGNLGMVALLQSPPDGHTMAMSLTGMVSINPTTYSKAGFTAADFTPVARVSLAPLVLVVPANSPWRSMSDLIACYPVFEALPYGIILYIELKDPLKEEEAIRLPNHTRTLQEMLRYIVEWDWAYDVLGNREE
ncbi:MAG: tripartite tricarboxylate transporter substrate binding protein, partial [Betaproteobacteria bacterium]|nr:tripartite tricarboxylate transporter substrate binding protein [Betaproteobacteria bacterium]